MLEILTASFFIMLASLSGVIFVWKGAGKTISRNLHYLVSFSAGVLLVVSLQLGREVLDHAGDYLSGMLWILIGAAAFWIVFKLLSFFHHHHDDEIEQEPHSRLDVRRILAGDAIHNIGDGLLIAASFSVSTSLGIITAISVFTHELVQEVSEFFVLKEAGYSTKKALLINFLVSSTILVGAFGSMFLLQSFSMLEVPLLGITAGAFMIVVFHDLIPHSVRTAKTRVHYLKHVTWFAIGVILMVCASVISPHSHSENNHTHDKHNHELHEASFHHLH